jgi:hypothetical protein
LFAGVAGWSGNVKENAMPTCQLRRLLARLQPLRVPETRSEAEILFWMDTFCIPVECKGDDLDLLRRTLKEKAIAFMTPIYARAERVLAIDYDIGRVLPDHMTFVELTARLASCGWMTRDWTYKKDRLLPGCVSNSRMVFCLLWKGKGCSKMS